jgi:hypothetical protein
MNIKNKLSKSCVGKLCRQFKTPVFFLSFHFGLIASWFINDYLTPLLFSYSFSEKSIPVKFGILIIYTCIFSILFYLSIDRLKLFVSKIGELPIKRKYHLDFGNLISKIKKIHQYKWLIIILMVILSACTSFYIFGENLNAQWWIIDDHEIMAFLGNDGILPLGEIPHRLMVDTEVGDIGGKSRFRPSYYFLRLLETSLWGNNPTYFYLFRLLICSFFIFVCWLLVKDIIGFFGGFIFTLAVMSSNYWTEIFSRLGPTESYVVLGISLFCFGLYGVFRNRKTKKTVLFCVCVFLGAIISIGSKENMVILVVPIIWMLAASIIKKQLTVSQFISSLSTLLFCALVGYAVLLGLSNKGGRDIYATDVSVSAVSQIIFNEIRTLPYSLIKYYSQTILIIAISYAFVMFGLSASYFIQKNTNIQVKKNIQKIVIRCIVYLGCIYLIFLSQRVFYAQAWPTGLRYDFPGKLGEMFTLIVLIDACLQLFKQLNAKEFSSQIFKYGYSFLFFLLIIQNNNFSYSKEYARDNVQRTVQFTQCIQNIKDQTSNHPEYPIIFQSYDALDFEPIFSTRYFLLANNVPNEVSIYIDGYASQSFEENTLGRSLASKLELTSASGGWVDFSPFIKTAELNGRCYSIGFSGESNLDCISLGKIW